LAVRSLEGQEKPLCAIERDRERKMKEEGQDREREREREKEGNMREEV